MISVRKPLNPDLIKLLQNNLRYERAIRPGRGHVAIYLAAADIGRTRLFYSRSE